MRDRGECSLTCIFLATDSGLPEVPNRFYDSGRIFLSLGSILFYVRLLHMFSLDSALGPTILMITQMMGDFRVSFEYIKNTKIKVHLSFPSNLLVVIYLQVIIM